MIRPAYRRPTYSFTSSDLESWPSDSDSDSDFVDFDDSVFSESYQAPSSFHRRLRLNDINSDRNNNASNAFYSHWRRTPWCSPSIGGKFFFAITAITALGGVFCIITRYTGLPYISLPNIVIRYMPIAGGVALGVSLLANLILSYVTCCTSYRPFVRSPQSLYFINYGAITVHVSRRELKQNPLTHLDLLQPLANRRMKQSNTPGMNVTYLGEEGEDAGGLRTEYLQILFRETKRTIENKKKTSLQSYIPTATKREKHKQNIYIKLGQLMMYCKKREILGYISGGDVFLGHHLHFGYHFDPSVFMFIFSLSEKEIETPIERFSSAQKFALYRKFLSAQGITNYNELLTYLSSNNWDEPRKKAAIAYFNTANSFKEGDSGYLTPDTKVSQVKEKLKTLLEEYIDLQENEQQIRGIQMLAKGMKKGFLLKKVSTSYEQALTWNLMKASIPPEYASTLFQGIQDRNAIANSLETNESDHISESDRTRLSKQLDWIKSWIKSKNTTDLEVQNFLMYCTGSSSLKKGQTIKVHKAFEKPHRTIPGEKQPAPLITSHTCSDSIDLRITEQTKEEYIKSIKEFVKRNAELVFNMS